MVLAKPCVLIWLIYCTCGTTSNQLFVGITNCPPSTICRAGNRILRNCSPAAEVDGDHRLALTRRQIEVRIGLERTRHDLEISQPAIVVISGSCKTSRHGYIWCRDVSVSSLDIQHLCVPGTPTETRERDFSPTAAWKDRFENTFKWLNIISDHCNWFKCELYLLSCSSSKVIFTRSDGVTYIETWKDGEQVCSSSYIFYSSVLLRKFVDLLFCTKKQSKLSKLKMKV